MSGYPLAAAAGLLGAGAGAAAKAAGAGWAARWAGGPGWEGWGPLLLPLALCAALNAAMWTAHTRALARLPSLPATVVTTAANLMGTGALGRWVFGERLGPTWGLGAACLVLGTMVLLQAPPPPAAKPKAV